MKGAWLPLIVFDFIGACLFKVSDKISVNLEKGESV